MEDSDSSSGLESIRKMLEELTQEADQRISPAVFESSLTASGLPIDIIKGDDDVTVVVDVPGFSKDEVDVRLDEGILLITAEREIEREEENTEYIRRERSKKRTRRRVRIPYGVDEEEVEAEMNNGVLEVIIPLKDEEEKSGKEIKIA